MDKDNELQLMLNNAALLETQLNKCKETLLHLLQSKNTDELTVADLRQICSITKDNVANCRKYIKDTERFAKINTLIKDLNILEK